jgi:hypothetical protein
MSRKRLNYEEAVIMYNGGLSIQQCADYYLITRQAMWNILKRRGVEFRTRLRFNQDNHFYRGGKRASDRAHNIVELSISKGIIQRLPCELCGELGKFKDGRSNVQAHHDDYNRPLSVRWLCQKHHHEWHKTNKPKKLDIGE